MIKILYLTELLTNGGTAKHLAELLPALNEKNFIPHIWMNGEAGKYAKIIEKNGINIIKSEINYDTIKYIKENNIDLVHSYKYGPHIIDSIISYFIKIPYIKSTRNDGHWLDKYRLNKYKIMLRNKFIKYHLVNSYGVKKYLIDQEKVKESNIHVIYNGIEDKYNIKPFLNRKIINLKENDFVLVSLCWLKKRKKIDVLIKSLAILLKEYSNIKLLIIGSGPEEYNLKQLAKDLNVNKFCHFLGKISNPYPYLRLSDVFLSASTNEGLSNSTIESLMMGVPCVVSKEASGNDEIVTSGYSGYLFKTRNDLVNCIKNIINNNEINFLKNNARSEYLKKFCFKKQLIRFEDYYNTVYKENYEAI